LTFNIVYNISEFLGGISWNHFKNRITKYQTTSFIHRRAEILPTASLKDAKTTQNQKIEQKKEEALVS